MTLCIGISMTSCAIKEAYRHDANGDGLDEIFANRQNLTMASRGDDMVEKTPPFTEDADPWGPIIRVNDLDAVMDWTSIPGIKRHWAVEEYDEPTQPFLASISNVRDVDGDGKLDVFRLIIGQPYAQLARFSEDGELVWKSPKLARMAGDETKLPVVDLGGDGHYQCVLSMSGIAYAIDAATGQITWSFNFAKNGYALKGDNKDTRNWDYPMIVGHFTDKKRLSLVIRVGMNLLCLDGNGTKAWELQLQGQLYGHALACHDVDGDGYDEIFVARTGTFTAVDHDGKILWEDKTQKEHSDTIAFGDFDGDGRCDVVYDHDGCNALKGPLYVADAQTGKLSFSIDYAKLGLRHLQGAVAADFRPDLPGPELACVGKGKTLMLFGAKGKLLWKRPVRASLISYADWDGDGAKDILIFACGSSGADRGVSVFNGRGERLYGLLFPASNMRMSTHPCAPAMGIGGFEDLNGNGRDDVLVNYGVRTVGKPQHLFLLECSQRQATK